MTDFSQEITQILQSIESGEPSARAELLAAAYDDLRRLANGKMAEERQNHTLSATALVHELSAKLLVDRSLPSDNRNQFFAYAAKAMRSMLIDYARAKGRLVRGGNRQQVPIDESQPVDDQQHKELLTLNEALDAFAKIDARKAQVVEMKYFGRMTNDEIATALDVSVGTVKRDWEVARGWLFQQLRDGED